MAMISEQQKQLIRAVVTAINDNSPDISAAVRAQLRTIPAEDDIDHVLNILRMPAIRYQRGMRPDTVIVRMYDALQAAEQGEEYEPPDYEVDDRY